MRSGDYFLPPYKSLEVDKGAVWQDSPTPLSGRRSILTGASAPFASLLDCRIYRRRGAIWRRKKRAGGGTIAPMYTKRARGLVEGIHARDPDLSGYEFEDGTKRSVPAALHDGDSLQEMRGEEFPPPRYLGLGSDCDSMFSRRILSLSRRLILEGVLYGAPIANHICRSIRSRSLTFRIVGAADFSRSDMTGIVRSPSA